MKSRVYFFRSVISYVRGILALLMDDKVTVYAAQASFFVIISSVPFISLLFTLFGLVIPGQTITDYFADIPLSTGMRSLISGISNELSSAPGVSLLSLSALTTLWSASRGIASIRRGIETVYNADQPAGFIRHRLNSILSTLLFIGLIVAVVALLLFDDLLIKLIGDWIGINFMKFRAPVFIIALTMFFTFMYYSIGRRSPYIKHGFFFHLPGAVFSSMGWIIFSYFYSLYIENFPGASYIYGGLAAICLIMLWLYFCMVILLLGAEINKLYFASRKKHTDIVLKNNQ